MVVFDDELPGFVGEPLCVMVSFTYAMCRQAVAPVPTTISTTLTAGLEVLLSQKKKRKLHKCCEEAGLTIFYDAGPAPAAKCMDFIWHVFSRNTLRTEPWEVAPLRSTTGTSVRQSSTRSFSQTNNFSASEVRSTSSYFPMLQNCLETKNEICKLIFILISGDFTAACCFASLFHFPSTAQKPNHFVGGFW